MTRLRIFVALLGLAAATCRAAAEAESSDDLRKRGLAALRRGDYAVMAAACGALADRAGESDEPFETRLNDCVGLGHAHQLAGDWERAVAAYQGAARLAYDVLKNHPAPDPLVRPPGRARYVPSRHRDPAEREANHAAWARAALLVLAGRIQRHILHDRAAAEDSFEQANAHVPLLRKSNDELLALRAERLKGVLAGQRWYRQEVYRRAVHVHLTALRELARTREQMGAPRAAIAAWGRLAVTGQLFTGHDGLEQVVAMGELLRPMPPGAKLPPTPLLTVLAPEAPRHRLAVTEPQVLAHAFRATLAMTSTQHSFAFAPPPGNDFDAITLTCDMERLKRPSTAGISCSVTGAEPEPTLATLGRITWPRDVPNGRKQLRQRFSVPPGAHLADITITTHKDGVKTREIVIEAEFRPARKAPEARKVSLSTFAIPQGGILTCGRRRIAPNTGFQGLEPGRYVFDFHVPGREERVHCEADLVAGGAYGLFINLDSPFRSTLTTLRGFGQFPPAAASLARLPDGRWLTAFVGEDDDAIHLSASRDLATWETPWRLPASAVFRCAVPTLYRDDRGTIWLACHGDRLHLPYASWVRELLWLMHTRDGRTWAPPRLLHAEALEGRWTQPRSQMRWGRGAPCLLRGPDGRHWLFWGSLAGAATSLADLRELKPIEFAGKPPKHIGGESVAIGGAGMFHMAFLDPSTVRYCTSKDGRSWSEPVLPFAQNPGRPTLHVQMLAEGDRVALIREMPHASWLHAGSLRPAVRFAEPIQVSSGRVALRGARAWVGPDGQTALLVGSDTVWVLRASRSQVVRPKGAEF